MSKSSSSTQDQKFSNVPQYNSALSMQITVRSNLPTMKVNVPLSLTINKIQEVFAFISK